MNRARVAHALFRVIRRSFVVTDPRRRRQLDQLARRLANRLAGHDQITLFGGAR